jgi:hypothetical protein
MIRDFERAKKQFDEGCGSEIVLVNRIAVAALRTNEASRERINHDRECEEREEDESNHHVRVAERSYIFLREGLDEWNRKSRNEER